MRPLEETVSGTDGAFSFDKELPAVGEGQQLAGSIRAELDGVNYTEILPVGAATRDVQVTVYSASAKPIPAPDARVVILEPGETEMIVREFYPFFNSSSPPVTYSSEAGTLRFFPPRGCTRSGPGVRDWTGRHVPAEHCPTERNRERVQGRLPAQTRRE